MPEARCALVVHSWALTENDFSSHDRLKDLYITNLRGYDREKIVASHGVGQAHVPVVAHDEHGSVWSELVDQFFGRQRGRIPLGFIPVAAADQGEGAA